MNKELAIKLACRDNNYLWPEKLCSGIMFYDGYRITLEEFIAWANIFKGATGEEIK